VELDHMIYGQTTNTEDRDATGRVRRLNLLRGTGAVPFSARQSRAFRETIPLSENSNVQK